MLRDLRHAVRVLLQAKAWTAVVVLSLALGIGANTALFSAANGLLLRTIPVRDPDTLVRLRWYGRNQMSNNSSDYGFTARTPAGQNIRTTVSYPMYKEYLAQNTTMEDIVACAPQGIRNLVVDGRADLATSFISSGNYYRMLGVGAAVGRTILPDDDKPGAPPAAVLSYQYWRSRFGSDPGIVGKNATLSNVPVTIVGVLSPTFTGIQQTIANPPDISVPLSLEPQMTTGTSRLGQATTWWLQIMGRLKPGVTPAQVQANLGDVFKRTAREGWDAYMAAATPETRALSTNRNRTDVPNLLAEPGKRGIYDVNTTDIRAVTILTVVVALVLLIVCANVANLLLSRATARQKEISVRLSLGATRGRLVRQLLTESVLLASIGGGFGILVGYWGQKLLPGAPGQATPLDWRVVLFLIAVTGTTGILFGIAPALRATRFDVSSALKETSRSVAGSRSILTKGLLVVQVAVSLVLLIGAGLFLRTLSNLRQVDVGFNPNNILLFRMSPSLNRYDAERQQALYKQLDERLSAVSGVRSVAWSNPGLLSGSVNSTGIYVQGHSHPQNREYFNSINRLVVSPRFFATMGLKLAAGREFTDRDDSKAPIIGILNEAAVKQFFAKGENPIGMRFGTSIEDAGKVEIVGILRDAKYDSVRDDVPPTMYVPYAQNVQALTSMIFALRTSGDPLSALGAVREAARQVDPNLPMQDVSTQTEQIDKRLLQERLFAQAYALFGGVALLLAAVGLFGLMSYSVARRTNEIGIRMALGAQRGDVVRMVVSESMWLVGIGAVIGLIVALAAGRLIATLLFGLAPTDAGTMLIALVTMLGVSALAGYLPARRAARVDPIVALHYE